MSITETNKIAEFEYRILLSQTVKGSNILCYLVSTKSLTFITCRSVKKEYVVINKKLVFFPWSSKKEFQKTSTCSFRNSDMSLLTISFHWRRQRQFHLSVEKSWLRDSLSGMGTDSLVPFKITAFRSGSTKHEKRLKYYRRNHN